MNNVELCSLENDRPTNNLLTDLGISKGLLKKWKSQILSSKCKNQNIYSLPIDLLNNKFIGPTYDGPELSIVEDNDLFIAIDKPAGIHGHPLNYSERQTVLNFLRSRYCYQSLGRLQPNPEGQLLYRLDRETSGLMIYIKNPETHKILRDHFGEFIKEKIYLCIAKGEVPRNGDWTHLLAPFGPKGHKMREDHLGERANLSFEKLCYLKEFDLSLVKVYLKTGMRHQIRVQFALAGHPLLGDELYLGPTFERLALHAYQYTFKFDDKLNRIKTPIPLFLGNFFNLDELSKMLAD